MLNLHISSTFFAVSFSLQTFLASAAPPKNRSADSYCTPGSAKKVEAWPLGFHRLVMVVLFCVEQTQVGDPARTLGWIAFASIDEHNDRKPLAWKALEHGSEAEGFAVHHDAAP